MPTLTKFFGPHIFDFSFLHALFSYEIQNTGATLLILVFFALIILEEPIAHLFIKEEKDEYKKFEAKHFWRTVLLIPVFAVQFLWVMYRYGIFKIYPSSGIAGLMILQFIAMMLLHDAYFYWCHRLLHTKKFWSIHGVHHRATDPTVVTSHVFHYLETFINFSFIVWFTLLAGLLFGGIFYLPGIIFIVYTITWNIYGHGKKDLFSFKITNSYIGRHIIWPHYHLEHHRKGTGNFGFFFTFWDEIVGTKIK